MSKKLKPSEIYFDVKNTKSVWDDKTPVVEVFLHPKDDSIDESDNLGRHNVSGVPKELGSTVTECTFEVKNGDLETIKSSMLEAGFTYKKIN